MATTHTNNITNCVRKMIETYVNLIAFSTKFNVCVSVILSKSSMIWLNSKKKPFFYTIYFIKVAKHLNKKKENIERGIKF